MQGHSPLGASGASRWMKCPGSVTLSKGISDEDSDFAAVGTAAHALAEDCLVFGRDAWEHLGGIMSTYCHVVDKPMADAVQQYLDAIRRLHPDRNQGNFWVERSFHCPSIHELFYGTSDAIYWDEPARTLHVHDYKNGAGIIVEVENNPQGMYYACGALTELDLWGVADTVVIHIHQPNGFHRDGPHRTWELSTFALSDWLEVLIPAMDRAMTSTETVSGEHCRFCPARSRACPQLMADMDELETMMQNIEKTGADKLTGEQVARFLDLGKRYKIVSKAANATAFHRLNAGSEVPGYKLAKAKTNRTWKDGADAAAAAKFGTAAYSKPALLSPAQLEGLPEGSAFCATWAFKSDGGLTVVEAGDARPQVSKDTKSLFQPVKKGKA